MTTVSSKALITEQRKFPRYNIKLPASIRLKDGIQYQGKTNNISNNGAFFEFGDINQVTKDTPCILTLFIEGNIYPEELKIKCVVKPGRSGGVGLEFKSMSATSFVSFIFLLSSKAPNPDEYFKELKNNPGVKLVDEEQLKT